MPGLEAPARPAGGMWFGHGWLVGKVLAPAGMAGWRVVGPSCVCISVWCAQRPHAATRGYGFREAACGGESPGCLCVHVTYISVSCACPLFVLVPLCGGSVLPGCRPVHSAGGSLPLQQRCGDALSASILIFCAGNVCARRGLLLPCSHSGRPCAGGHRQHQAPLPPHCSCAVAACAACWFRDRGAMPVKCCAQAPSTGAAC